MIQSLLLYANRNCIFLLVGGLYSLVLHWRLSVQEVEIMMCFHCSWHMGWSLCKSEPNTHWTINCRCLHNWKVVFEPYIKGQKRPQFLSQWTASCQFYHWATELMINYVQGKRERERKALAIGCCDFVW